MNGNILFIMMVGIKSNIETNRLLLRFPRKYFLDGIHGHKEMLYKNEPKNPKNCLIRWLQQRKINLIVPIERRFSFDFSYVEKKVRNDLVEVKNVRQRRRVIWQHKCNLVQLMIVWIHHQQLQLRVELSGFSCWSNSIFDCFFCRRK